MARFVTSILIASAVVGASMATLAIQPDTVPGRPALTADPLMTRLLEAYRIQGVVFSWPMHRARYLRVSDALYNGEAEYEFLAKALGGGRSCPVVRTIQSGSASPSFCPPAGT